MIDTTAASSRRFLGIEIGGTKLQVFVGDDSEHLLERHRLTVDRSGGAAGIRTQLERLLPELAKSLRPVATGVGFGGPVDRKLGKVCLSHQVEGWSDFPLGAWIGSLTKSPVRMDNDANVGALGEASHGAGVGFSPMFYVTLGSGVGGGLVVDGAIYHGALPGEAEIGHVRLDRVGTILESRCSGWAVDAKIRAAVAREPKGTLAQCVGSATTNEAKWLGEALAQNDPLAKSILEETVEDLAFGLSHVTHLFHPKMIVLGGGLSLLGEPLRSAVARLLPRFTMEAFAPGPQIALARLGEDAVPVGALALAKSVTA